MAKVTINIPQHKLPSFLNLARQLGLDKSIETENRKKSLLFPELNIKQIRKNISQFILFDWEFFSNELEFE